VRCSRVEIAASPWDDVYRAWYSSKSSMNADRAYKFFRCIVGKHNKEIQIAVQRLISSRCGPKEIHSTWAEEFYQSTGDLGNDRFARHLLHIIAVC